MKKMVEHITDNSNTFLFPSIILSAMALHTGVRAMLIALRMANSVPISKVESFRSKKKMAEKRPSITLRVVWKRMVSTRTQGISAHLSSHQCRQPHLRERGEGSLFRGVGRR
mmetsp:Transcript_10989/g.17355  ORF Transcript_10989/g.17355 Transcript_10989/m.17355 type:complete len:112 (-) Transcript_10989:71-406(-)